MNKLNDIFKMISQMEKNAEEVNLGAHKVNLATIYDDIKGTLTEVNKDYIHLYDLIKGKEIISEYAKGVVSLAIPNLKL